MSENLFIIFTLYDGAPVNIRKFLTNNFENEIIIGINRTEIKRGIFNFKNEFDPELLVIYDHIPNVETKIVLTKIIAAKQNIYAVYHKGSNDEPSDQTKNQQRILKEICTQDKKLLYEAREHHDTGAAAGALNKITELILQNNFSESSFRIILKELLEKPIYTRPILELKLELLHLCLSPEGKENAEKVFEELITLLNGKEELVRNNFNLMKEAMKPDQDCFSDNYVSKLENLRKNLLE